MLAAVVFVLAASGGGGCMLIALGWAVPQLLPPADDADVFVRL